VTALLIVASAVDIEFLIIPEEVTVFGMLGGLLAGFLVPQLHVGTANYQTFASLTGMRAVDGLIGSGIGLLGAGLMVVGFAVLGSVVFRREAMGFGDASLMAMIGAFFGWKVALTTFMIAPFVGLLYGLPLLFTKDEHIMPYGPWLSMAAIITLVFRDFLCRWADTAQDLVVRIIG
jgi:leader peptidase (prepilin peptidase)/N-methyltransferase